MSEKIIIVEGVIGKLGGFFGNSVQERYFILKGHLLAYYLNQEESKKNNGESAKGALECRCVDTVPHDDPRYQGQNLENKHLRLTLRGPLLKRDYVLEFKTIQDRVKWVDAIRHARINSDISRHELGLINIQDNSALFFSDAVKAARLQLMDSALNLFAFDARVKESYEKDEVTPQQQVAAAVQGALQACGNEPTNLRVVDASGTSLLHIVCANPRYPFALVQEFVFKGAMLHARDFLGRTLLHVAIQHGRVPDFIKGLIQAGISPLVTDSDNKNAFHYIAKTNHTALVEPVLRLLVQATNTTFVPARAAATGRDPLDFADFINSVSGNRGRDRSSVLFVAAENQYMTEKELQLFMTYGADPTWSRRNDPVVKHEAAAMTSDEFQTDLLLNASVLSERPDNKLILGKCLDANHTPGAMWYNRIVESSSTGQSGDQKILDSIALVLENKKQKNEEIQDNSNREDLSKIAACCNFNTLKTALLRSTLVVFDRLIELGADATSTSSQGECLQHIACRELNRTAVDRLLDLGIGLKNGKKETNGAIRSKSVLHIRNAELDLTYPIDLVFQSAVAHGRDPMPIWDFLNHLLLRGSPATPHTLAQAITTKKHDVEVFAKLSSRVLEFAGRSTLREIAPMLMGSLVFNGGVEKNSQDSHLREKYGPMIDTIVDVTADLCKKGAKLDGVDECGDSRLHGIIIRSARIKPSNVAGIVGLFVETGGPRLLFLKNSKGETIIDLVKERTGRLDSTMRVINEVLGGDKDNLAELAAKYDVENEEAKLRDKKQEEDEEKYQQSPEGKSQNVSFANNNTTSKPSSPVLAVENSAPASSAKIVEEEKTEIAKKDEVQTKENLESNEEMHLHEQPQDADVRKRAKSTMMTVHAHTEEEHSTKSAQEENTRDSQQQQHYEAPVKRNAAADIDDDDAEDKKSTKKIDEEKEAKKENELENEKEIEEKSSVEVVKEVDNNDNNNETENTSAAPEGFAGEAVAENNQQPECGDQPESERAPSDPTVATLQDVD